MKDTHYSPARAVAKYCDEHVCLCVCLCVCLSIREHISGAIRAIFTKKIVHVAYGRGSVTKSQGKGQFWGFSSPLTMHCNAFAAKGIGRERVMAVGVHSAGEV